jgi:hypothetical protein
MTAFNMTIKTTNTSTTIKETSIMGGMNQQNGSNTPEPAALDATKDGEDELYLDTISQFPLLNGYSHGIFGFKTSSSVSRDAIVDTLRAALEKLVLEIPWLGGQMLQVPDHRPGFSDIYVPAPWPKSAPANQMLRVRDCEGDLPSMAQITRAGAPISMLKGDVLTPWPSLPMPHGLEPPLPVIAVQANFIRGGLLLNVSPHHVAIDGVGFIQFLKCLATVLKGQDISPEELEQANRDRSRVIQLIPRGEPVKDYSHLRRPVGWMPNPPKSTPKWCYYKIPVAALPALRKSGLSSSAEGQQLVSDNDIVCAFCWQRISVVRLARGLAPSTPVKFTRAIDGRSAVGVPHSYMGHMAHHSIAQLPLERVVSGSLSSIAQTLRRALSTANNTWATRSYATFVAREPDKSALMYGGLRDVNIDLGATSFVASAGDEGEEAIPDDFGPLLGRVCFLRRPLVSPLTGTITVGVVEGGALPVCLCLPEDDIEALKKDSEWKRYMRYVG